MASITQVAEAIRHALSTVADECARPTGFTKRQSKLTGAKFAQTLVLGFLAKPAASIEELCQQAAILGLPISRQGLDQRFTREAAGLLEQVLNAVVAEVIAADPVAIPLLGRFSAVVLQDSSVINLPEALAAIWRGCGGTGGTHAAALKLGVRLDVLNGTLYGPTLEHGRTHDRACALPQQPLPAGALCIQDLGFFKLARMREFGDEGVFFLTRLFLHTLVFDEGGQELDLLTLLEASPTGEVDRPVRIGGQERLPVRLLAVRVPQEVADRRRQRLREEGRRRGQTPSKKALALAGWTILVTNAPAGLLSLPEALVLARVRWQVELLFKRWKDQGKVDEWRSEKSWRILCEVYAKLSGMVIEHWLSLVSLWAYPNRSLAKAADAVRGQIGVLAWAMAGHVALTLAVEHIGRSLATGCRMDRRKSHPGTYQLLLALENVY